jgi:hypothetical protein
VLLKARLHNSAAAQGFMSGAISGYALILTIKDISKKDK